jgi:hypothetical protein
MPKMEVFTYKSLKSNRIEDKTLGAEKLVVIPVVLR